MRRSLSRAGHRLRSLLSVYKKLENENFCAVLEASSPGMFDRNNLYSMDLAIRTMPEGDVLEIGSYAGLSANVIVHLLRMHGRERRFFACDKRVFEEPLGSDYVARLHVGPEAFRDFIKASLIRHLSFFSSGHEPYVMEMTSDEFFRAWDGRETRRDVFERDVPMGGAFGFVYIDGNHSYDIARRDFEAADRSLVTGGYILMDDSADHLPYGCARVAREMSKRRDYRVVLKNPHYLFRKVEA